MCVCLTSHTASIEEYPELSQTGPSAKGCAPCDRSNFVLNEETTLTLPQPLAIHATCYQDAHLTVDFEREAAYLDGVPMKLTCKAYSLLAFLVRRPGELVPRDTLLLRVWGYGSEIRTRTLDVHIRR